MKTYLISYNNHEFIYEYVFPSIIHAQQRALVGFTSKDLSGGLEIVIYENDLENPKVMMSYNRFTCKQSNIGKWITI